MDKIIKCDMLLLFSKNYLAFKLCFSLSINRTSFVLPSGEAVVEIFEVLMSV